MKTSGILDMTGGALIIIGLLVFIFDFYGLLGLIAMFVGVAIVFVGVIVRIRERKK